MTTPTLSHLIHKHQAPFICLNFTDILGKDHSVTLASGLLDEHMLSVGKLFDGSSLPAWRSIENADMLLRPIEHTATLDPFLTTPTICVRCEVIDPLSLTPYDRDPRTIAQKAEQYLQKTGIADTAFFGPEVEFFLFNDVKFNTESNRSSYEIDSIEGAWNTNKSYDGGNRAQHIPLKGGYCASLPFDAFSNVRSEICKIIEQMGLTIEAHHHEVASAAQQEIAVKFNSLVKKADETQIFKYVVHNVAQAHNLSACFMAKPIIGDNGSGMHCNISLAKEGKNIFIGDKYAGLSQTALYFIGGIIKHARALNAFTNPTTNSYKRLVTGYEAPVLLAYSANNRSASIRIPAVSVPQALRIEARFPDPMANPYLAFSALLMAGIDGILNQISPGEPKDTNLYRLAKEELSQIPSVARSLDEALDALENDYQFLTQGGVFTESMLKAFIELKRSEVALVNNAPHPLEFCPLLLALGVAKILLTLVLVSIGE